jgi:heme exporter protein A
MNPWVIEAENLCKTFSWTPVLHGVSCRVAAGEIVSIFGPNGAGKTTFLRILATLLKPSSGVLRLFARAPSEPTVRQRIGFLGHESFLYPDLTPIENLTFYGRAYGLENLPTRIAQVLQQVNLQDWGNTPVRAFSQGMEQRASLARTLLHEPQLFLLDEPYTGLDTYGISTLQTVLVQSKEQGKTVVLTTHDFALGLELGSRALILHHGRIVWQSTGRVPSVREFAEIYHTTTHHP